jgi:DNA ligase (NAD+)
MCRLILDTLRSTGILSLHTSLRLLMTSVATLRRQVREADAAYRAGHAVMTDAEFDALTQQLRAAAPHAPELQVPGGGSKLLSLENGDAEALEDWIARSGPQEPLCVAEKVDGCALAIRYVEGRLSAAWTRSGKDATRLAALVAPVALTQPLSIEVRGELYDAVTGRQSVPAQALRRAAAPSGEGLAFIAYTLVGADGDEFLSLERLARLGFDTVTGVCCATAAEVLACHRQWRAGCFGRSELPTDGIVIRIADHDVQRELGSNSKAPRYAFAMK